MQRRRILNPGEERSLIFASVPMGCAGTIAAMFSPPPTLGALPEASTFHRWIRAYLRHAPLSLAVRELNRLVAIHAIESGSLGHRGPVLDVGCGDGFWWSVRGRGDRRVVGVDISEREISLARRHIDASLLDISERTPEGGPFGLILGNCSLEHVRRIDRALTNLRRVAAPDARLVIFVPSPSWAYQGRTQELLLSVAPRTAMALSGAFNGFFQHWHLYDINIWKQVLAQNGWRTTAAWGIGSSRSEFLFRLFLPPAFGSFLVKNVLGVYPELALRHVPGAALSPIEALAAWGLADPIGPVDNPHAYEYAIVAEPSDEVRSS